MIDFPNKPQPLSHAEIEWIDRRQHSDLMAWRRSEETGVIYRVAGVDLIVYPTVSPPFENSLPLIANLSIHAGESILDVGTGCGVLAIAALQKGADRVLGLDVNPTAVGSASRNFAKNFPNKNAEARFSDVYSSLREHEKFDVILSNLPFRNRHSVDLASQALWDTDFQVHRNFFARTTQFLNSNGRVYLAQANFGDWEAALALAENAGLSGKVVGEHKMPGDDPRIFYAFELKRS